VFSRRSSRASWPPTCSLQLREVVENGVTYQRMHLPGTDTTTEMSKPELPTFGCFAAVPVGAELQVEILAETPSVAPLAQQGAYTIYPAMQAQTDQGSELPFEPITDSYKL
jgi:hypothetical protein